MLFLLVEYGEKKRVIQEQHAGVATCRKFNPTMTLIQPAYLDRIIGSILQDVSHDYDDDQKDAKL